LSNATDSYDRVMSGFADLLVRLRNVDEDADTARRIRLNTQARESALNRVWKEYSALGLEPPSDLALSITARLDRGIGIPISRETDQPIIERAAE